MRFHRTHTDKEAFGDLVVGQPRSDELQHLKLTVAERVKQRAARARAHALSAREQAARDAEQDNHQAELLHYREAHAHQRAAARNQETASLYRLRLRHLNRV